MDWLDGLAGWIGWMDWLDGEAKLGRRRTRGGDGEESANEAMPIPE